MIHTFYSFPNEKIYFQFSALHTALYGSGPTSIPKKQGQVGIAFDF